MALTPEQVHKINSTPIHAFTSHKIFLQTLREHQLHRTVWVTFTLLILLVLLAIALFVLFAVFGASIVYDDTQAEGYVLH